MAFGEILRSARIQRGLTPSDVAEATRMLVQVVEGLEQEDFRRIAAPIYGRGFVKLYAELLELDPEPLVADFMELYNGGRAPAVLTKKVLEPSDDPIIPATVPVPVTRTVSTPVPRAPQPIARPVAIKETADNEPDDETAGSEFDGAQESGTHGSLFSEPAIDSPEPLSSGPVAEAELPPDGMGDLDLFSRPLAPQRKSRTEESAGQRRQEETPKRKFPIFQVGGRGAQKDDTAEYDDDEARARREARLQAFKDGIAKLKEGVGRKLSGYQFLQQKQVLLVGCAGLVVMVLMIAGIHKLFKLTSPSTINAPAAKSARVMPPPPLYVD